nr:ORF45 nuclear phosphoprotein [Ovine gammaherpesvirus 2]
MAMFLKPKGALEDDRMLPLEGAPRRKRTTFFTFPAFKNMKQLTHSGNISVSQLKREMLDVEEVFYPEALNGPPAIVQGKSYKTLKVLSDSDWSSGSDSSMEDDSPRSPPEQKHCQKTCQPPANGRSQGVKRSSSTDTASSPGSASGSESSSDEEVPPAKRAAPDRYSAPICKRQCGLEEPVTIGKQEEIVLSISSSSCGSTTSTDSFDFVSTENTTASDGKSGLGPKEMQSLDLNAPAYHDHIMPETPPIKGGAGYPWPWK